MRRPTLRLGFAAAALLTVVAGASPLVGRLTRDRFDHEVHKDLFPSCLSCHAGITSATAPTDPGVWPAISVCATCHDGTIEERVDWVPPPPPRTNLRFTHPEHAQRHRMNAGIIVDSEMIEIRFRNGRSLGKVEEQFAASLPTDRHRRFRIREISSRRSAALRRLSFRCREKDRASSRPVKPRAV